MIMGEADESNQEAEELLESHQDASNATGRHSASFSVAQALGMIRRRQEDQRRALEEEERRLDEAKKLKAREKRQRRRQNQKQRKAKLKDEALRTKPIQSDSNSSQSEGKIRGQKRLATELDDDDDDQDDKGTSGEINDDDDDDGDHGKPVADDDSKLLGQPSSKKLKITESNSTSADRTSSNETPEQQRPTASNLYKQLIPRALLVKRNFPGR